MALKLRVSRVLDTFLDQEGQAFQQWQEEATEEEWEAFIRKLLSWLEQGGIAPEKSWEEMASEEREAFWQRMRKQYPRETAGASIEAWLAHRYGKVEEEENGAGKPEEGSE